ncbi:MAG: hypothetical protein KKA73_21520 [Chloroflexi bacterium]|nr:hypothetical protein [Chloroflexota bacterium]MBU1750274.1 hypothetical protein [Chloroflexota bacterium]
MIETLRTKANELENLAVDLVAKVAPWCAPLPTAYLVGRATVVHLGWPDAVGIVAAVIVESLGLATAATALELREYNQGRRKSDPAAPFILAAGLVGMYLAVAVALTVALDIAPPLAVYAPAIFPALSLAGVTVLAIRADHRRRLDALASVKQERKAERQAAHQPNVVVVSSRASKDGNLDAELSRLQAGRRAKRDTRLDTLWTFYRDHPGAAIAEAGRAVGVSRQTVYTYLDELESAGRVRKNGNGWEVV